MKLPTINECVEYGRSIRLPDHESEHFFDYFESNGWKVGRNPMKNWQAAMRNWKRNQQKFGNEDTSTYIDNTRQALGLERVASDTGRQAKISAWDSLGLGTTSGNSGDII